MEYSDVQELIIKRSNQLETYIRKNSDDSIFAIILMVTFESDKCDGDYESFGAYYGYHGGGVNDGGFFKLSAIDPRSEVFGYDDLETVDETEAAIYEGLMQEIWTFVDDKDSESDLFLTDKGLELVRNNGGFEENVIQINDFDGDSLDGLEWGLHLFFES